MRKLFAVVRVEIREETREWIEKSDRKEYAGGGFRTKEKVFRVTESRPYALLSCGHWRSSGPQYVAELSKAKKLACLECEPIEIQDATETD